MEQNKPMTNTSVERWGWYSIAVTLVLVALNLTIALASKSLVVGAEAFHNFADFLTAVAILVGLKFSTRKSGNFPSVYIKSRTFSRSGWR
jgi:divalent metal cation (Fe/Co/Zn/Cd) transporter